ncbi:M18 family aminopeptidase [Clostridium sp. AN503]|uniref:M18 family aminopeptidase n=1 Tax=Clostridium sp. AN503 TaxID=3160598 RepID=UPI0034573B75
MSETNMAFDSINKELLDFLDNSPSSFHAVANMKDMLEHEGYSRLLEGQKWELRPGAGYYVTRNDSALIAFKVPRQDFTGFQIMASHSDSPVFKIKANAEIEVDKKYVKLNVEKYGGMICSPWLDRPLSVAGRIVVRTEDGIASRLVNVDRDLMIIPNLAIHMNRSVNEGYEFNAQKDMLPLFCDSDGSDVKGTFLNMIAREAGVSSEDILDTDLFLYNRMKGTVLGLNGEYIASPHLDDLQCAFASLKGFLAAEPKDSVAVHCVLDNEEVGSGTKQGAASTFLKDVLHRINSAMGRTEEEYLTALASSFMVSADNAHSIHPNQPDKGDPTNRPYMNHGIVIKYSANQKYTTDAVSGALFKALCEKAGVPYQTFHNRSDMLGGSTLGNISGTQVALNSVDIGLAQLAMHSNYETAGSRDTAYLIEAAKVLFSTSVYGTGDGDYRF